MERQEVKDQERQFEELPAAFMLDIIMARRQHDNEKRDKWTTFFRRTGQWGSGSTGSRLRTIKNTNKKDHSATMVYICT